MSAFYVPLGEGRFRATERTSGPWDPQHQHAGPPSALLLRAFEQLDGSELVIARMTVEILGPVPIGELEVRAEVERPGRSVELLAGTLSADGRDVLRARAWRVRASPVGMPEDKAPGPLTSLPDADDVPPAALGEAFGYAHAVEWRWVRGGWLDRGPATVWTRMKLPLVEGEEPSPRQRVVVVADSGNGASNVLDWSRYLFINTELTVHFAREPVGEWVLLDAATQLAEGGAGLASSVLSDRSGPVARGAQALFVAPR
ncbi:thioesterase family protein [Solirubrobacter phytolaccae]|uniref:Thioesterase family protein n=1 Tax=Solirubrobacter phytolaccae TaxID=1404360 RepID=A0A9X3S7X0_9ACTN|nr:thioesterase family protein [Solirubrobacter phytolaccae]MDA0180813.1 thioesterase family protein [Solirubrobacter phytolaccae]